MDTIESFFKWAAFLSINYTIARWLLDMVRASRIENQDRFGIKTKISKRDQPVRYWLFIVTLGLMLMLSFAVAIRAIVRAI